MLSAARIAAWRLWADGAAREKRGVSSRAEPGGHFTAGEGSEGDRSSAASHPGHLGAAEDILEFSPVSGIPSFMNGHSPTATPFKTTHNGSPKRSICYALGAKGGGAG